MVEQQIAQTKQVILVPQQVYVPFVQATNFGAVRVNGVVETRPGRKLSAGDRVDVAGEEWTVATAP